MGFPKDEEIQVVGSDGNYTIKKHPDNFKNSYNPSDTVQVFYTPYGGVKTIEGEIFETFWTEKRQLYVYKLPNKKDPKICNISFVRIDFAKDDIPMTVTKLESGRGWHYSIDYKQGDKTLSSEFDIWYGAEDQKAGIVSGCSPYLRITKLDITIKASDTSTFSYTLAKPGEYGIEEVQEGLASTLSGGRDILPFNITETRIKNGKTETFQSTSTSQMNYKITF